MARLRKRRGLKAKQTSVAPEHVEGGPVKDTVANLHPFTWSSYTAILDYYDERMETPGIDASDSQLAKLSELLYVKRKASGAV